MEVQYDDDSDPYVGGLNAIPGDVDDLFGDNYLQGMDLSSPETVKDSFSLDLTKQPEPAPENSDLELSGPAGDSIPSRQPAAEIVLAQTRGEQKEQLFSLTFPEVALPRSPKVMEEVTQPTPAELSLPTPPQNPVAQSLTEAIDPSLPDFGIGGYGTGNYNTDGYDTGSYGTGNYDISNYGIGNFDAGNINVKFDLDQFGSMIEQPAPVQYFQPAPIRPPITLPNPPTPSSSLGAVSREDGKKINHNRRQKLDPSNDPSELYRKMPPVPSWGSLNERKKPKFQYWHGGPELYPNLKLSKKDMVEFFLGNGRPGARDLTIWIQNTPAQVNSRYQAGPDSAKCRYADCPAKGGTILKGFLRVAFDENTALTSSGVADPFHNAGYMHLYCFEEVFDVGFMVHYAKQLWGFNVRIDARNLEGESRNPMSIRRDHDSMGECYSEWREERLNQAASKLQRATDPGHPSLMDAPRHANKKDYLWRRLTDRHLELEGKGRKETRQKRGGANIELHKGDLRKYLGLREGMRNDKRRAEDEDDEDARPSTRHQHAAPPRRASSGRHASGDRAFFHGQGKLQPPPQPQPQNHLHQLHTQQLCGSPRTRKRSRETEECIRQVLATSQHLTRRSTHEIVDLLEGEPDYIRDRVLSVVPEHAEDALLAAAQGSKSKDLYHDRLEERVHRLPKRQRHNVSGYTETQEQLKDPRKHHSV